MLSHRYKQVEVHHQAQVLQVTTLLRFSLGDLIDMASLVLVHKCPQARPCTTCLDSALITYPSFKFHVVKNMPHSLQVSVKFRSASFFKIETFIRKVLTDCFEFYSYKPMLYDG